MIKKFHPARAHLLALCLSAAGAASAAPTLWVDDSAGNLGKVDVATGAVTLVGSMGVTMTDIAFDPSGNLYGISFSDLYSINSTTAAITHIGSLGASLNSLVFGSDGTLYSANNQLYTVSTSTGLASLIGSGGASYSSSGDLAFVGGNLYLSSTTPVSDSLVKLNLATGAGTAVGAIGTSGVFGLATNDNITLYGVAGTDVYGINTATGAGALLVNYSGHGLGAANGSAFLAEAAPPVPEPATTALMLAGLALVAGVAKRGRRA